jgi:apolipoprotein N-acyltransferase
VWPEALVTDNGEDPELLRYMSALTQTSNAPLFTGAERHEGGVVYNSSMLVDTEGEIAAWYDKIHLAPFGEYTPFERFLPFLRQIVPGAGLGAGDTPRLIEASGRDFGPLICFEVLFAPMSEWYRRAGADFLVVITNLGWFGGSNAIPQELEIARMRAVETRLPLVHCANTGISGVFDPLGNFTPITGLMTEGGLYGKMRDDDFDPRSLIMARRMGVLTVPMYSAGRLPHGTQVVPWLALAAVLGVVAWVWRRPAKAPSDVLPFDPATHDDVMI